MPETMTRHQVRLEIGANPNALWGARCDAYGEDDDHITAWAWLRDEGPTEGVDVEPGSVVVTCEGRRIAITA